MKGIVNSPVCPLMTQPRPDCELADEALYGMVVEVLEETTEDYWKVRTPYRYEGYAPVGCLYVGDVVAEKWENKAKKVIFHKNFADVMADPKVQSWPLVNLPLGAAVAPVGEAVDGWQKVELVDGSTGYVRASWLDECYEAPLALPEWELRQKLVDTARLYARAPYCWGGKTPMGIDCSGLVSMAYLLNGITIYRDAHIKPDFDLVEIPKEEMAPADLLFFPGHVAMYLGDGQYLHSTGKAGSDGVDVNSLNPKDPNYRADLAEKITQVGSFRGFH